ncbi:MAG: ribosome silencing factor [Lachnospiraceae bacterium]
MNQSKEMLRVACHAMAEKKAEDLKAIDLKEISIITDYFAICSCTNSNQMQAMVDAIHEDMHKAGYTCKQTEGNQYSSWILVDYTDIIIHVFTKEDREFYNIERIWSDGKKVDLEALLSGN